MDIEKMGQLKNICVMLCIVLCYYQAQGADKYTDGNRPYEFGFKIDGEQHRHEKKDENGIVMGEFGFITADGVYHVTVYATDENGRFKILSMKNIRVKPYPTYNGGRQGQSSTIPSTQQSSIPSKIQQITKQENIIAPDIGGRQGHSISFPTSQQLSIPSPSIKNNEVKQEGNSKSCSSCRIPTTSTSAPFTPVLGGISRQENYNRNTQINTESLNKNQQHLSQFDNSQAFQYSPQMNLAQNYPQKSILTQPQQKNTFLSQNYPNQALNDYNQNKYIQTMQNPSNYVQVNRGQNVDDKNLLTTQPQQNLQQQQTRPLQQKIPSQQPNLQIDHEQELNIEPQQHRIIPSQTNLKGPAANTNERQILNNFAPSATKVQEFGNSQIGQNYPYNTETNFNHQSYSNYNNDIPQKLYQSQTKYPVNAKSSQETILGDRQPKTFKDILQMVSPEQFKTTSSGTSLHGSSQQNVGKPVLLAAQMQLVHKNTNINHKNPGESDGLPKGLTKGDMSQLLYTFNYTLGFQAHHEEGYRNGAKIGYYYVTGRNGVRTRVDYVADESGFHPRISQEVLDVQSDEVPKPETEKDEKFGLKGYEFKWLYYPVGSK